MPDVKAKIALELNGEAVEVAFAPHKTLLEVLREDLGLTGTKHGCELGECGTCTVLVDGTPVLSCLLLGLACAGRRVKTVEGMAQRGTLHPLQEAFAELGAAQCGYCTPAFLLAAEALLASRARPTRDEIKQALSGNLCRCTGYIKIYEAVELAAARMRGEDAKPAPETLRSEEHTSELQSRLHLVCRLLLEKKKPGIDGHGHARERRVFPWG